ncbi:hypothetical protein ACLI4U_12680 [Natrialbaceae archaeon A-CW2]
MKRRDILAGVAVSTGFVAGCLSGANETSDGRRDDESEDDHSDGSENNDSDEIDEDVNGEKAEDENGSYERCTNRVVGVGSLPESARDEVLTAIEQGEYETEDDLILPKTIDIDNAFLASGNQNHGMDVSETNFYKANLSKTNGRMRLQVEEKVPSAGSVSLTNRLSMDEDVMMFDVRIEYLTEDEVLTDETVKLGNRESIRFGGADYRWGDYRAEISTEIDDEQVSSEVEWTVNNYRSVPELNVSITDDESYDELIRIIRYYPYRHSEGLGSICRWNQAGELTKGRNDAGEIVENLDDDE